MKISVDPDKLVSKEASRSGSSLSLKKGYMQRQQDKELKQTILNTHNSIDDCMCIENLLILFSTTMSNTVLLFSVIR